MCRCGVVAGTSLSSRDRVLHTCVQRNLGIRQESARFTTQHGSELLLWQEQCREHANNMYVLSARWKATGTTAPVESYWYYSSTRPHHTSTRSWRTCKVTAAPYSRRTRRRSPLRSAVRKTWTRASCPARGPGRPRSPFERPRPLATAPSPGNPRRGRGG